MLDDGRRLGCGWRRAAGLRESGRRVVGVCCSKPRCRKCWEADEFADESGLMTRGWRADADVGAARGGREDSVVLRARGWTSARLRGSFRIVVGP